MRGFADGASRPETFVERRGAKSFAILVLVVVGGVGAVWAMGVAGQPSPAAAAFLSAVVCAFYLAGPAAYVKVTRPWVVVANTIVRYDIPREFIREVTGWNEMETVYIFLLDGRSIAVGALESYNGSHRRVRKRGKALERALREMPEAAAEGPFRRKARYVNIALGLAALTVFVQSIVSGIG